MTFNKNIHTYKPTTITTTIITTTKTILILIKTSFLNISVVVIDVYKPGIFHHMERTEWLRSRKPTTGNNMNTYTHIHMHMHAFIIILEPDIQKKNNNNNNKI